jgi:hypothetical protein
MQALERRRFLIGVSSSLLLAGIAPSARAGRARSVFEAWLEDDAQPLDFGAMEPLVRVMQETEPDKLLPELHKRVKSGTKLETLVAAAALANARTFAGEDYEGFHAFMAMLPTLAMASCMSSKEAPLPVFKVLHRNTSRIAACGGRAQEKLRVVQADETRPADLAARLTTATRDVDVAAAERAMATTVSKDPQSAYCALQALVHDDLDVHRVVLAWRSWDILRIAGGEYALPLLRQELHYAVDRERTRRENHGEPPAIRAQIPELVAQYHLADAAIGERRGDDAWVEDLAQKFVSGTPLDGATEMARTLAGGHHPEDLGEALSLAATELLLRDPGRTREEPGKPVGSVHGASIGVHASDSANAWRHIAAVVDRPNAIASWIAAGSHTAGQGRYVEDHFAHEGAREAAAKIDEAKLLDALSDAVAHGDQASSAALAERAAGRAEPTAIVDCVLPHLLANEGALHNEKYFATQLENLTRCRPAFRARHAAALARVAASSQGFPSAAVAQARELIG